MGPIWALNNIPVIQVGTIWAAHIGTKWFLKQDLHGLRHMTEGVITQSLKSV